MAIAATEDLREAFAGRLVSASIETMDVLTIYLGDRLGLYRALSERGALTAGELASAAGINERYAREWLEQQAATGILAVDDVSAPEDERRFSLPPGHADVLVDPESPYSVAPLCRSLAACAGALPALLQAFRSGEGIAWEAYGTDMIEAQGDFNRPWLVGSLATEYLPSIPDLHDRLQAGARVADIACGVGWAAIAIARAYPNTVVHGFDLDELSIELAQRNAQEAGLAERAVFEHRDAADPALQGAYDIAIVVEAIHDMSDPVGVLRAIREMLAPGGTLVVADEKAGGGIVRRSGKRDRATLLRLQRPHVSAVRHARQTVCRNRHRHAIEHVPGVCGRGGVRGCRRPTDRARLPTVLSTRSNLIRQVGELRSTSL